ncbi:MAG: 50S ribosomal protein L24 [Patescibacteria group bacterium]
MMNIHKNDTVQVISGKDRGKKGKVLQVLPKSGKIIVEGANMAAKTVRAKRAGEKGQVVRYNAPINASNAMLFCQKCSKPTRPGFVISKEGKKTRVCRKCAQPL